MGVEELRRENDALNEQVKLLVKTERRLYGAQHVIELQLRRLQALTELATQAARARDPDRILSLALEALVKVLDADQAVALVPKRPAGTRLAAIESQPGREPGDAGWPGDAVELPILDKPLLFMPRATATGARLDALLDAVDDYFAPPRQPATPRQLPAVEIVVPLRRKSGRLLGVLVLRRISLAVSIHERRIGEADLPFIELVATRVETDVENIQLYRELERFAIGLERKVEQRTSDLARINDELGVSLRRVRETQEQLVEASKSTALLTLVAGLSHELNNPIAVMLGYAQGLKTGCDPSMQHQLEAMERQARRCSQLVKALLALAENRPLVLERMAPASLLERAVADAAHEAAEHGVKLCLDVEPRQLPSILVSEQSMRETLGQLIKNALDASVVGGRVRLSARERRRNGVAGVALHIRDSGAGIPDAFLSRIFDPFFTTKPPGKGVGLGLSLARRSIEQHGGHVDVRSRLGRGTLVRIWLPVAEGEPRALGPLRDEERPR